MKEKTISKNLEGAEKSWTFLDGSIRTAVILESVAIGRGTYLPGWKWSEHVGKQTGKTAEHHIGYVVSGRMVVKGDEGKEVSIGPGDAFELASGHDAWVVGDEPCVALDFEQL
jgi:hypothetical protein